ncbi:acyl carrier protein [Frankia sp. CNm7]|uniref:Acyl carrier protein n=1 Tax=Frankia nepalensis TaxID=1836974 RepID=A0A937RFT7_9ACTN|nr:acyl carrier protein [Frankia nepalensis]MBL7501653.1 acyl carrier protein [Frankia nepalensis]MBL7513363.1 acyl carrier protein [Frankia nepalensis]MBL7523007.1 acyl carrier protein [Frankia nepalensis]MBL7628084.1 acyl carrier protein [Frankia nepalensis]
MTAHESQVGSVLTEINDMINMIIEKYGSPPVQVTMDTLFHSDLELESIDLVTLGVMLAAHYGDEVSMAEFLAEKDLGEVIALRVGELVDYVVSRLDLTAPVD